MKLQTCPEKFTIQTLMHQSVKACLLTPFRHCIRCWYCLTPIIQTKGGWEATAPFHRVKHCQCLHIRVVGASTVRW